MSKLNINMTGLTLLEVVKAYPKQVVAAIEQHNLEHVQQPASLEQQTKFSIFELYDQWKTDTKSSGEACENVLLFIRWLKNKKHLS